jgi:F-type H+-transporting ATPase subunit delta
MKINRAARSEAKTLFRICRSEKGLDEARLRKVVEIIAKKKPRGYLQVLGRLGQLIRLEVENHTHEVISSVKLEDGGKAVFAVLEKHFGKPLAQEAEVRPEVLGGLRIRVGSDVWDATIRGRLEALARSA